MGGGTYSSDNRVLNIKSNRSYSAYGADVAPHAVFREKAINNAMSPYGIKVRESRDSKEHPNSLAIILALDETGSMRTVPHYLVRTGLPNFMDLIIKSGITDPQVLFIGIGDHECDNSPLQVSQFESSDELMDHWLTKLYLEGGGGGNDGESYLLAWYFAAYHTSIDCFEKRKKRGYLFTVGDEPTLGTIPANELKNIMGDGQYSSMTALELLSKASESYNVFHLHIMNETNNGQKRSVMDGWKQIIGDNLVLVGHKEEIPRSIADIIVKCEAKQIPITTIKEEVML